MAEFLVCVTERHAGRPDTRRRGSDVGGSGLQPLPLPDSLRQRGDSALCRYQQRCLIQS